MIEHELKCHPKYFQRLATGQKNFEIRENDRNYQVGDRLIIKEYDPQIGWPDHGAYDVLVFDVTYIETYALVQGFVALGLRQVEQTNAKEDLR